MTTKQGTQIIINVKQTRLKRTFLLAKSTVEMLKTLEIMESCFKEDDLGAEYLSLATQLLKDGSFKKAVFYGKKALNILIKVKNNLLPAIITDPTCAEHSSSMCIAFVLHLLGLACFELKMIDESLGYLNWADKDLSKIELDLSSSCGGKCILNNVVSVQNTLAKVKANMGRKEESVVHLLKLLEVNEVMREEGCMELGVCNKNVYEGYFWCMHSKEALPFCLRALEICGKHMGSESVEVAGIVADLALIYNDLGEYEKALEKNKLAQSILKKKSPSSPDLLEREVEKGNVLIGLGRNVEALKVLKSVVLHAPAVGSVRAVAHVYMAKAYCGLQRFDDAKKYMKNACKIFEQFDVGSRLTASVYGDMSRMYEKMNDFETALTLWSFVLQQPVLPHKLQAEGVRKIFSLVSSTKKEKKLMPYLKDIVEKLKKNLGPNHCQVGYSYARLGFAYMKVGKKELALKSMADAKDIMSVSLGPHHLDSLITSQMLSVTYGILDRYHLAIPVQEEIIEGLERLGPREQDFMDEARRMLNRMKGKVAESSTRASFQSKDCEDLSAKISKCGLSDGE